MERGYRPIPLQDGHRLKFIIAAADAGRYGDPPPRLLTVAFQIKRWNALPEAGGLLDQPAGLLPRAGYLYDVYTAHRAYRDALLSYKGGDGLGDWEARNADIMQLLKRVRELKKKHGN